ncbi:MAG TPA: hypothetical protein VKU41_08375 [Polyangiaceae bacterium]|nr:hypothetical protein [Polyangiaceae bacterium]
MKHVPSCAAAEPPGGARRSALLRFFVLGACAACSVTPQSPGPGGAGSASRRTASATTKTFYSQLTTGGNFGPWNDSTSIPDPGEGFRNGCAVYAGGYVFVLSGNRNKNPSVYVSAVHADGVLSNWGTTSPIPPPGSLQSAGCTVGSNGFVYLAGGTDQAVNTLYYAQLQ